MASRVIEDSSCSHFDFVEHCENKRLELIGQGLSPNDAMEQSLEYGKALILDAQQIDDDEIDEISDQSEQLDVDALRVKQHEYFKAICNLARGTSDLSYDECRLSAAVFKAPIVGFEAWLERTNQNG